MGSFLSQEVITIANDLFQTDLPKATQDVVDQVVANSLLTVENNCVNASQLNQATVFSCNPLGPNGGFYEENDGCIACLDNISTVWNNQMDVEKKLWQSSPPQVRVPWDQQFESIMNSQEACVIACKACEYSNNSQLATVNAAQDCIFDTQQTKQIQSDIIAQLTFQLNSNEDVLAAFARTVGSSSFDDMIQIMTNMITTTFDTNVLSSAVSQINVNQQAIYKTGSGGSTTVNGNTQEASATLMVTFLSENKISESLLSQSQWDLMQDIYNESTTIDSVGRAVFGGITGFNKAIEDTVAQILVALVIILLLVLAGLISVIVIKSKRGNLKL